MTIDNRYILFEQAAKFISGPNPPDWLVKIAIPNLASILKGNVNVESERLGRNELRQRLEKAEKSARHLQEELQDWEGFFPMLLNDPSERLPYEHEILEGLEALAIRCKDKLAELPKKKGAKFPLSKIDRTPSGTVLCALAVGLSWKRIHGRWPTATDVRAQNACLNLWAAAGGSRRTWGDGPTGWRVDLKEAKNFSDSWQAKALLKQMDSK